MTKEEFKRELFLKLFDKHYEDFQALEKIKNEVNKVSAELHGEDIPLEDIREGPFSGITLSDAVERLAFDLKTSPRLYESYLKVLIEEIEKESKGYTIFRNAHIIGNNFLQRFIKDVETNKKRNESI